MPGSTEVDRITKIKQVLSTELRLLETNKSPFSTAKGVLLTGATGSTGSYILRALIADHNIPKIYCLVRKPDARERLQSLFPDCAGLQDEERVIFLNGDITDPQLGIKNYETVAKSISTIIHTAWLVNYNLGLAAYQVHLTGLRYLLNLLSPSSSSHFIFVSSMFSIANTNRPGHLPSAFVSDPEASVPGGYGESKFVAESILNYAACKLDIGITALRIGQISGPLTTSIPWKDKEWFPALLKTSKAIGELPTDFGPVTWIPMDVIADIVHEVFLQPPKGARFFNCLNYRDVSFESLAPSMQRVLGNDVNLTTRAAWVRQLEKFDSKDRELVRAMPALKLLWFYKYYALGYRSCDFEPLRQVSPSFRDIKPIQGEWVEKWVRDLCPFIQGTSFTLKAKLA